VVAKRAGRKLCIADGCEHCFIFCVAVFFKKVNKRTIGKFRNFPIPKSQNK
jgi:hypothetical protein